MSIKSSIIKLAIKLTPNKLIIWVANIVLKDIAELTDFNFDIEARTAYVQVQLLGEAEPIEVWLDNFAILNEEGGYKFILQAAKSNKLWLDNLMSRFVAKAWKIPVPAQFLAQFEIVAELLKAEVVDQVEQVEPEQID